MTNTQNSRLSLPHIAPGKQGLYDPAFEHDACGVGFVAHIRGEASHQILLDAEEINCHMDHRGGNGFEANTGDGAGILTALPHKLFAREAASLGFNLPAAGQYGTGNIFLPQDEAVRADCKARIEAICAEEGQQALGWRPVPIDADKADVGPAARACMPVTEQLFVAGNGIEGDELERRLYLIRKRFTRELKDDDTVSDGNLLYACSFSTRVIVYKLSLIHI